MEQVVIDHSEEYHGHLFRAPTSSRCHDVMVGSTLFISMPARVDRETPWWQIEFVGEESRAHLRRRRGSKFLSSSRTSAQSQSPLLGDVSLCVKYDS